MELKIDESTGPTRECPVGHTILETLTGVTYMGHEIGKMCPECFVAWMLSNFPLLPKADDAAASQ